MSEAQKSTHEVTTPENVEQSPDICDVSSEGSELPKF